MFTIQRSLIHMAAAALALAAIPAQAADATYTAKLTGANQLPEAVNTEATGTLQLKVSPDGKTVTYVLTVANISNPSGGDIHLGPIDANGPLVVKLFPKAGEAAKKGPFNGVLAEGTFTAADLIGSMSGSSIADLIDELKLGKVYTNVHTNDGQDPPNSGPGDYRNGEIRGQLK